MPLIRIKEKTCKHNTKFECISKNCKYWRMSSIHCFWANFYGERELHSSCAKILCACDCHTNKCICSIETLFKNGCRCGGF